MESNTILSMSKLESETGELFGSIIKKKLMIVICYVCVVRPFKYWILSQKWNY